MSRIVLQLFLCLPLWIGSASLLPGQDKPAEEEEDGPIRALLVTGGSTHDYEIQSRILTVGIQERFDRKIEWTVRHEGKRRSDARIPTFQSEIWAEDFDIVVHNYCFPRVFDTEFVDRILKPHREGVPAVLLHASLHSFRVPDERWFAFCGAVSRSHGDHSPIEVTFPDSGRKINPSVDSWKTPRGELYEIEKLGDGSVIVAEGKVVGEEGVQPVSWLHEYGESATRVFATSLGNDVQTMMTPEYLGLVTRGFAWALDQLEEDRIRDIPAEESLQGIKIPVPEEGLRLIGTSMTTGGRAEAQTFRAAEGWSADLAVDGDSRTWWQADAVGPSFIEVSLPKEQDVEALLVQWKQRVPDAWILEASKDGLQWELVGGTNEGGKSRSVGSVSVIVANASVRHLRVTVPKTMPGEHVAIREIAAYRRVEALPAAFLVGYEPPQAFHTLGMNGEEREIRLAEGWSIEWDRMLPPGIEPRWWIDTGSGRSLLLADRKEAGDTCVFLLSDSRDGEREPVPFLEGMKSGSSVAWDGEWVYQLEGFQWTAFRDTNGDGRADERFGRSSLLSSATGGSLDHQVSGIQLCADGWVYGIIQGSAEVPVIDRSNREMLLPSSGVVRFRIDGSRFEVLLSSVEEVDRIFVDSRLEVFVQSRDTNGRIETRRLPPLAGEDWTDFLPPISRRSGNPLEAGMESILPGNKGWLLLGAGGADPEKRNAWVEPVAEIEAETIVAAGSRNPSFAVRTKEGWKAGRLRMEGLEPERVEWDAVPTRSVLSHLQSPDRLIRKEAVFEALRRRQDMSRERNRLLREPHPLGQLGALLLLSRDEGSEAARRLAGQTAGPHAKLAYRLLGDREEARNHPAFEKIAEVEVPEVSAEILGAIFRTDTRLQGLEELALGLASTRQPSLSYTSSEFLRRKGSTHVCFAVLDDPSKEGVHEAAFEVLERMPLRTVVEGIVLRLEQTTDPAFRKRGLEALCGLYYSSDRSGAGWDGTKLIRVFLDASLTDPRVDRSHLLDVMMKREIPIGGVENVVRLAEEEVSLGPVILSLLEERGSISKEENLLLESIVEESSHDEVFRRRAAQLLLSSGDLEFSEGFRLASGLLEERNWEESSSQLERAWLAFCEEQEDLRWLRLKARSGSADEGGFAWRSLLRLLPDLPDEESEKVRNEMKSVSSAGGNGLVRLIRARTAISDPELAIWVSGFLDSEDEAVREAASVALKSKPVVEPSRPTVPDDYAKLASEVEGTNKADIEVGWSVFQRSGCASCHNVHGEGPLFGPDIVKAAQSLTTEGFVRAILSPENAPNDEFSNREVELSNGVQVHGIVRSKTQDIMLIRDRAGNDVEIPRKRIRWEWQSDTSLMHEGFRDSLGPEELASLRRFLRSLAGLDS